MANTVKKISLEAKSQMIFAVLGSLDDSAGDNLTQLIHKGIEKEFGKNTGIDEGFIDQFMSGLVMRIEMALTMSALTACGTLLGDGLLLEFAGEKMKKLFGLAMKWAKKLPIGSKKSKFFNKAVSMGKDESMELAKINSSLKVGTLTTASNNLIRNSIDFSKIVPQTSQGSRSLTGNLEVGQGGQVLKSVDKLELMRKFGG